MREPRHRGHGVSFWLRELLIGDREQAGQAMAAIGPRAVPAVVKALRARDSRLKRWYLGCLNLLPPSVFQWMPANLQAEGWNEAGICALAALGTNASAALPDVLDIISRREVTNWPDYLGVLPDIAPEAGGQVVPVLRAILHDPTLGACFNDALLVLAAYGPQAIPALPEILIATNDPMLRCEAIRALGEIGPPAREALPMARAELQGKHYAPVVLVAAEAIWRISGESQPLVEMILEEFGDEFPLPPKLRLDVYRALGTDAETLRCALERIPTENLTYVNGRRHGFIGGQFTGQVMARLAELGRTEERFAPSDITLEQIRQVLDETIAASRQPRPAVAR